jgi:hypothetical protein
MPDTILSEDFEVIPHLAAMDLNRDGLIEVVRFADSERALCTNNDAPGFAAMTVYDKAARRLREIFCGEHWVKDDTDGQAGIRHVSKNLRVIPCNFDENTASPLVQPKNNSPKGEVSGAKTRCNATGWLPGLPDVQTRKDGEIKTVLLGIRAVEGEPLKAELCVPVAFNGKYFTRVVERVSLLRGDEDDGSGGGRRRDDEGPTNIVDIAIFRK